MQAVDADNQSLVVTPLISSVVTGVSLKNQTADLITDLGTIAIADVIDVSEAEPQSDTLTSEIETNSNELINGGR